LEGQASKIVRRRGVVRAKSWREGLRHGQAGRAAQANPPTRSRAWLVLLVLVPSLLAPATAFGGNSTTLPLTSYGGLSLAEADGHVFVSGGNGSSTIAVLDTDGNLVSTITGLSAPSGMAYDASSSTLYVAQRDASSIAVIDAATATKSGSLSISPLSAPRQLALAGGRLWFSHDCPSGAPQVGTVASIAADGSDLDTGAIAMTNCLTFAVSPSGETLVIGDTEVGPTTIRAYDISTDPPTLLAGAWNAGGSSFLEQMAVEADGAAVLTAGAWPHAVQSLSLTDLSVAASYATISGPNSVALSADGNFLAAGRAGPSGVDVFVYETGSGSLVRTYELGARQTLQPRGLAFSADAGELYAVTRHAKTGQLILRVLGAPTSAPATTSTTLAAPTPVTYNRTIRVKAHVNGATSGTVAIYATPYGSARELVAVGRVDDAGNFSVLFRMKTKTTFVAEYEGDDAHAVSKSSGRVVRVLAIATLRMTHYYGRSGQWRLYHAGTYPRATGSVIPSHPGVYLTFVAQRYAFGAWRRVAKRTLFIGPSGAINVYLKTKIRASYRMRTTFGGDVDHLGDTSPWAYFRIT
jgi:DNA-binding beta-propeller fold protein YncE